MGIHLRDWTFCSAQEGLKASLVVLLVKNLPAMQETPVRLLGPEDPLEEGMAIHSSVLAWRIRVNKKPTAATSINQ